MDAPRHNSSIQSENGSRPESQDSELPSLLAVRRVPSCMPEYHARLRAPRDALSLTDLTRDTSRANLDHLARFAPGQTYQTQRKTKFEEE